MIKKYLSVILIVLMTILATSCSRPDVKDSERFKEVYELIADEPFVTGEINHNIIILKDKNSDTIKKISINNKIKIEHGNMWRNNGQVFFVLGGSVDDNFGIMFSKSSVVNMDGLWELKRITGNSYYYSTRTE